MYNTYMDVDVAFFFFVWPLFALYEMCVSGLLVCVDMVKASRSARRADRLHRESGHETTGITETAGKIWESEAPADTG